MSAVAEAVQSPAAENAADSRLRRWTPRGVLALTMLFTGAAGLIYEYVLSTVFSYLLGSSIEQFSITIGIMFAMMGLGGWLQTYLKHSLVEYFIAAELLLVLLGGFAPIFLQWAYAALPTDFVWIKLAYPAMISILIGIEIPLVMRINERFAKNLSSNIAGTWAWDYIGGAAGVVVWILMLRHYVPITHISFWVAGCNLAVAIMSLIFFWRRGMFRWKLSGIVAAMASLMVVFAILLGNSNVDAWSKLINQKLYDDPIAMQITSKYQNIVVTKGPHPTDPADNDWQLWLNGNRQFSSLDEPIYHELTVHPAMNLAANRNRVLILGGGDGMVLREVLKYKDVQDVTLVDLDPEVIKLAKENPIFQRLNSNAFADARVHSSFDDYRLNAGVVDTGTTRDVMIQTDKTNVKCHEVVDNGVSKAKCTSEPELQKVATVNVYNIDADRFVSERTGWYDVVIVDLPDPNSVELAKLYSKEFYSKIKRVLSPDGVVAVQATSPYHAKETFLCMLRTMTAAGLNVVPYHENVPSFGDWGWMLGSPSISANTLYERANSMPEFPVPTKKIGANNMSRALVFNKGDLESRYTEVSSVMENSDGTKSNIILSYYLHEAWRVE